METLETYFFVALLIGFASYLILKNKKIKHPTADEERVFIPQAPSKPKLKKIPRKKGTPTGAHQAPVSTKNAQTTNPSKSEGLNFVAELSIGTTQDNPENEIKQLQMRTGWDYDTAKTYCLKSAEYQQKIAKPVRLKNN
jgi:hypothetical protein